MVLAAVMAASLFTGCGSRGNVPEVTETASATSSEAATAASAETAAASSAVSGQDKAALSEDRAGNSIKVPDEVNTIISMSPAVTQVLVELGLSDKIIACDTQSPMYAEGLKQDIPQFDMMEPDQEQIMALKADIIFTSGMSSSGGTDVFAQVRKSGACIADIPSSTSIEGIGEDIRFIGDCVGESEKAEKIVSDMNDQVQAIKTIGDSIKDKKNVLFEISASPEIYSTGKGTFIDEMISDIGAVNVVADQDSWCSVTDEAAINMNPDVILTSVNYTDDPVGDIRSLEGWKEVTAVKNGDVYYIDNASSSLPNEHIVEAMKEMAKDIYPDEYKELK